MQLEGQKNYITQYSKCFGLHGRYILIVKQIDKQVNKHMCICVCMYTHIYVQIVRSAVKSNKTEGRYLYRVRVVAGGSSQSIN